MTTRYIISRYNESIGWLHPILHQCIIFNKGDRLGLANETKLENVGREICNPRIAWTDEYKYMVQATKLRDMFVNNYKQYIDPKFTDYSEYGPK